MERLPIWLALVGACAWVPSPVAALEDGGAIAICVNRMAVVQTLGDQAPFLGIVVGPGPKATPVTSEAEFRALCSASHALGLP